MRRIGNGVLGFGLASVLLGAFSFWQAWWVSRDVQIVCIPQGDLFAWLGQWFV